MIITKVEEYRKTKVKVYIDELYQFWLYKRDLRSFHLEEDTVISEQEYKDLYDLNLKRAKMKALNLLKQMDRTEFELELKLKQADYNEEIISQTISYIHQYHYIDDARYVTNYIGFKKNSKSKKEIQTALLRKGIDKDVIDEILSEEYNDEDIAIQRAIAKKTKNKDRLTIEEKRKLSSFLYNKGFQIDLIKKYMNLDDDI